MKQEAKKGKALATMFESFPDAIYLADRESGLIIDVNPAGERLIGLTRDEIIGMHQAKLHPPALDEKSRELFLKHAKLVAEGIPVEFSVIHSSGKNIPVEITGKVISLEGRDALMGIFRDITERKEAQERLRKNQETLNQAQRVAHLGIWSWDMANDVLEWSDENFRIFGLDPASDKPDFESFKNALHPEEMEKVLKAVDDAVKGIAPFDMVHKVIRPDGEIRLVHGQAGVVLDENGKPFRMVGTGHDITERLLAEKELENNLKLIGAINQAQTAFIAGKRTEDVFYQLLEVIRSVTECDFAVIMEYEPPREGAPPKFDSLAVTDVPMNNSQLGEGPSFNKMDHLICSPVKQGKRVIENDLEDDSSYCSVPGCCVSMKNFLGAPIREGENIIGLVALANRPGGFDDTVAQRLESTIGTCASIIMGTRNRRMREKSQWELVRAKEEAEEATRLKDKFVSMIAHDLRSPFTSILGFMRLLEKDAEGALTERQAMAVRSAINGGEHMLDMIDDVLDISRLKTGKIKLRPKFTDLAGIAALAINKVSVLAEEKEVALKNKIKEGSRVYADPGLYSVVVQNILANAIKFSQPGQVVEILCPDNMSATLAVKDHGVGISADMLKDIFRHEIKTSRSGTKGERGTGLGMPFSRDIMEAHGGKIWADSTLGAGTTMYTLVPYVRPKALVVDDNPGLRALARVYLEDLGAEVLESGDGAEGLKMIFEQSPHLVLTDIYMPGISGLELVKAVRESETHSHLPIIVVTSDASVELREHALRAGADDFTVKPLAVNEFIPRVRRFIG